MLQELKIMKNFFSGELFSRNYLRSRLGLKVGIYGPEVGGGVLFFRSKKIPCQWQGILIYQHKGNLIPVISISVSSGTIVASPVIAVIASSSLTVVITIPWWSRLIAFRFW